MDTTIANARSSDPLAALGLRESDAGNDNELGQSEFLRLMTTQLQAQDPLEPMDNGAFIGQLAQFSTVNGMDKLVSTVETLAASLAGNRTLDAATLVGRDVLVPAEGAFEAGALADREVALDLPEDAFDVRLLVRDTAGRTLETIALGDRGTGLATVDAARIAALGGRVRLEGEATIGGAATRVPVLVEQRVEAVTVDGAGGAPALSLEGGEQIQLDAVRKLS